MQIRDWPASERPRERLLTHGPGTLSEAELARSYCTIEALKTHPRLARFIAWVARRPPGFQSKVPGKRRKR